MAQAIKKAIESSRGAYLAGRMEKRVMLQLHRPRKA